jgi:twinkle protein
MSNPGNAVDMFDKWGQFSMSHTIEDLLYAEGILVKSSRLGTTKMLCPKCSASRKKKTDPCLSVTIEPNGATWLCHNCEWAGGVSDRRSDDFHAPKRRPDPVKPSFVPQGPTDTTVEWFALRGISRATISRAGVSRLETWMPDGGKGKIEPVIAFPYIRNGEIVNVKYRTKDKRFRQEKGAEKVFYGLDLIGGAKEIYIVEGEIDALSLREIGFANVLSVPDGAPKNVRDEPINPDEDVKFSYIWNCREELAGVEKFILATDADGPGQALAEELARRFGREKCWRVTWPEGRKDANEVLVHDGAEVLGNELIRAKPWPIDGLHEADDYRQEVLELYRVGRARALSTGWNNLDKHMTIAEGQLSIVTGIPNSGKSEFVDAIMVNMALKYRWSFAICSFENPPAEHLSKFAEKYLDAPFWDGPTPRMSEPGLERALDWAQGYFTFIRADGDKVLTTLDWILEKAGAAVMRYGVRGVVIDPWNEIEHQRPNNMTETEYIGQSLSKIKRFAAQRGVHVWVVAHPSKIHGEAGKATPVPSLYDISGSANWANKADLGIVVYRNEETTNTDIHVKKCRFKSVGSKGVVSLSYNRLTGRYSDIFQYEDAR